MNHVRIVTIAVGLTMAAFGAHQITKPSGWHRYVPDWLKNRSPLPVDGMLRMHGSGNLTLGLFLLSGRKQRLALNMAAGWWAWVAPFCGRHDRKTAVRDGLIAVLLASTAKSVR